MRSAARFETSLIGRERHKTGLPPAKYAVALALSRWRCGTVHLSAHCKLVEHAPGLAHVLV
jgi:hypothetical protein